MTLTVGQTLWYVPTYRHPLQGRTVTVSKIGRKWATLDGNDKFRIDTETMMADGGEYSSPGRCWLSEEAYEREQALNRLWNDFASRISRGMTPNGVTEWDILAAAALLHIPIAENR